MEFRIVKFKPKRVGRIMGFATVVFGDVLTVYDISVYAGKDGELHAGLPQRSYQKGENKVYEAIVEIEDKERKERFSAELVKRLERRGLDVEWAAA